MKSSDKQRPTCVLIISQKQCFEHEYGCTENDLAIGWVLREHEIKDDAKDRLLDMLERLGWQDGLSRKV